VGCYYSAFVFFLSLSREGCFYRELEACPAVLLCCIEGNSSCDVRGDVLADTNALRVDGVKTE
jgi:hypothetical protein